MQMRMTMVMSWGAILAGALGIGTWSPTAVAQHAPVAAAQQQEGALEIPVGDTPIRLQPPAGQVPALGRVAQLFAVHDLAEDHVRVLAAYQSPETSQFSGPQPKKLPAQGLLTTLVVTEEGLDSQYVDSRALRDVLADELGARKAFQDYLAQRRFGAQALAIAIPEPRLIEMEEFLVVEGKERVLPQSKRRISYCVEAFVALRNRAVLGSTCLLKPVVDNGDMYRLETDVLAWARALVMQNPSSRAPAPPTDPTPAASRSERDDRYARTAQVQRPALVHLRHAVDHRRLDVTVASALLWSQLPSAIQPALQRSNERFASHVAEACRQSEAMEPRFECQLLAYEKRLRALEQCTAASLEAALGAESVEFVPGQLPRT